MVDTNKKVTYKGSGVDIDAGDLFTQMIKKRIEAAWPGTGKEIGGFSGGGPIPRKARMVKSSTDGVGTKLKIAAMMEKLNTVGQDAVAMSAVDSYIETGVVPQYLLDYFAVGKLRPEFHIKIIEGLINGCKKAGCKLIGGETAELPGFFLYPWLFDIATFAIVMSGSSKAFADPEAGFDVYGWPSCGPASNGYSLIRRVFDLDVSPAKARKKLETRWLDLFGETLGEVLLRPTPIWIEEIEREKRRGVRFAGHAHITGGGIPGNVSRILPDDLSVVIDRSKWVRPSIFGLTQRLGNVGMEDMERTFNNGIMVVSLVDPKVSSMNNSRAKLIGKVVKRKKGKSAVQLIGEYEDL